MDGRATPGGLLEHTLRLSRGWCIYLGTQALGCLIHAVPGCDFAYSGSVVSEVHASVVDNSHPGQSLHHEGRISRTSVTDNIAGPSWNFSQYTGASTC